MKYVVTLCCLLFAVHAFADNAYFEGYVTVKAGSKEANAKVQYVFKDGTGAILGEFSFEGNLPLGHGQNHALLTGMGRCSSV